jgi:hypothetical protein
MNILGLPEFYFGIQGSHLFTTSILKQYNLTFWLSFELFWGFWVQNTALELIKWIAYG